MADAEYPGTLAQFDRWFATEDACRKWLLGTHQGAVERKHLPYYLDEFTFRFNRRTSRHRGMLFYRLVQQALAVDPAPYGRLVGGSMNPATQAVGPT